MPRSATGQIVEHPGKDGKVYRSLRFRAYGQRYTKPLGVVSRAKAEKALEHTMADVERGIWEAPPQVVPAPEPTPLPTFHVFAEEWWTLYEGQWDTGTTRDYRIRLEVHLIPWFGEMRLDEITFETIERYIAAEEAGGWKPDAKPLAPETLNKMLHMLDRILARALKRKLIDHNPADDEDLRVVDRKADKAYLDAAGPIEALLDAAGELDTKAPPARKHIERRALLAMLIFAGPRHDEALKLRWRDVHFDEGWLDVQGTKTAEAKRKVKIRGRLRAELLALRQRQPDAPQSALLFPTTNGRKLSQSNVRDRVLGKPATVIGEKKRAGKGAVGRANEQLEAAGLPPLPDGLEVQSLRCTFASILYALGASPVEVMQEMGHGDPALALRIYAKAMRYSEDEKAKLRALVEGPDWANMGERAPMQAPVTIEGLAA